VDAFITTASALLLLASECIDGGYDFDAREVRALLG